MILIKRIVNYTRVSLKKSLRDVMKSKNRMIAGIYSPAVFSLDYEEVEYKSIDGKKLYAWLIKNENAKKTIVLCHGRFNNRIFLLKFLRIFVETKLNEKYNILLPDLRNSGMSEVSKTALGYFFSYDIYSSLKYLKDEYGYNNFTLYGFSQGAMGASLVPTLFENELEEEKIIIEKMILDSPVSNVRKLIIKNSYIGKIRLPYFLIIAAINQFNRFIDNKLEILRLSKTLGRVDTLIIQSEKDEVTPYEMLIYEYNKLDEYSKSKTKFKAFRKGQHVRIYLQYKEEYTKEIKDFLEGEENE
ncbi:alpha/beta hydrolase [Oceanivirga miroungae]|uniref:AB hydrolase-1 domain-containing protein n=1 Tax=Oceanivirga miroungae TaxID=1130046 RepID=A0A6I8MC67_9FUSO|nr:alpha/beta hydrolase [Oceanivirga miroungae]VWL84766.1 hypothetical protein OMES3154_00014 [Oceanivirga miroungae]